MWKIMLARIGLATPPHTVRALAVQQKLIQLERHLANQKDGEGMRLARALHRELERAAREAPAGAIDLAPLSGGLPKPPEEP